MPKKDGSPTVAEKRAARKASGTVRPGSVADNRAKAQEQAQTMLQYKVENNINKAKTRKKEQRQLPARQQREGSVAYNRANNNQSPVAGAPPQAATQPADNSNAYKYTKADNSYSGSALRTKMAGGQDDPLMREIDSSNGYQTFQQRTHDEDGKFNTNKFFSEAIKGYENDGLSNTEMMSTEGLYQDRYHGPSSGSSWSKYAGGAQHSDAEAGVFGTVGAKGDNFYKAANKYMADGGYAGDVLKQIDQTDGEKGRLTSPDQIAWYNSVVKRAQDFDWSSTYGEGKGTHDPRGLEYGGKAHEQRARSSHDPSTEVSYDPSSLLPNKPGEAIPISNDSWGMKKETSLKQKDRELAQKYPGYVPGHKTPEGWVNGYMPGNATKKPESTSGVQEMSYGHSEPEHNSPSNSNLGYQDWESQMANAQYNTNPYSTKPGKTKASNMNLTFDPYKY